MHTQTRLLAIGSVALAVLLTACGGGSTAGSSTSAVTTGSRAATTAQQAGLSPKGETVSGLPVIRVVDGDTLHVRLDGRDTTVRMVGMNTPETVKEDTPVECYGPEASAYAKSVLKGATVTLEFDESQGRTDQYGRTLAYVWLEAADGSLSLLNLDEISRGLARERQYGPTPYAWKTTFKAAQQEAKASGAGLWGACPV